ncbi:MAG: cysteine--tRNA ligase [Methyloceanibacter sp.]
MALRLYNTLTRKKEPFQPLEKGNVRMYVCGPTVYDFAHIGNARPVIVFDVLFRLLRHLYGPERVTYVRNITDVDDKINARAGEEYPDLPLNEAIRKVTEKTERQFHEDVAALGCLPPTVEPRATQHIAAMEEMIDGLVANGCAYVAEDHVLFHVAAMPDYGKLSGRSLDEMIAGARIEVAPFKKDPMDFVLWKPSKPGEPSWPSPAGIKTPGRPGWHIECSAMSWKHLGQTFDIHGGGIDLVFPHHENEIAQSRCAFHTPVMAKCWLHNGFLQVEGEKMAKSLGNFVTVHELFTGWKGYEWERAEIRLLMLSTYYRQPLDWTLHGLWEARKIIGEWKTITANVDHETIEVRPSSGLEGALLEDLNTPEAIMRLHDLAQAASRYDAAADELYSDLVFLGLFADRRLESERGLSELLPIQPNVTDSSEYVVQLRKQDIESKFRTIALTFEPSANVVSTSSSITSHINVYQPGEKPEFLNVWVKYGPEFISSSDMKLIERAIGIEELNARIERRLAARKTKAFAEADSIRDELAAKRITLKDAKDPKTGELVTTWEVAR